MCTGRPKSSIGMITSTMVLPAFVKSPQRITRCLSGEIDVSCSSIMYILRPGLRSLGALELGKTWSPIKKGKFQGLVIVNQNESTEY